MRARALLFLGGGGVTLAWSELAFYPVDLSAGLLIMVLVYGTASFFFFAMLGRFRVAGWPGVMLAAGLFGFAIEGVVVPVLYEIFPFNLVWTSLAWHGLLSILVGLVLFRRCMAMWRWPARLVLCVGLGAAQGFWGSYMWSDAGASGNPVPISEFAVQSLIGALMFLAGHLALDRVGVVHPDRRDLWGCAVVIAATWAAGPMMPYFPTSLVLPALALATFRALARLAGGDALGHILRPVPAGHYAPLLAMPIVAIAVYGLMQARGFVLPGDIVAAFVLMPLSVVLWVRALWQARRAE